MIETAIEPPRGATSAVAGVHFADANAAVAEDFPVPQGSESSSSDADMDVSAEDEGKGAVHSLKNTDTDKLDGSAEDEVDGVEVAQP